MSIDTEYRVTMAVLICLIFVIIGVGWWGAVQIQKNQSACVARGGKVVVVGHTTTYVSQKIGTTIITTPIDVPITKCVEAER